MDRRQAVLALLASYLTLSAVACSDPVAPASAIQPVAADDGSSASDEQELLALIAARSAPHAELQPGWDPTPVAPPFLGRAVVEARALGKPLLVFVVPAGAEGRFSRGTLLGILLMHGDEHFLADLALCEIAFAALSLLEREFPALPSPDQALAYLIETDSKPYAIVPITAELAEPPPSVEGESRGALMMEPSASAIRAALAGDAQMVLRRERAARAALRSEEIATADEHIADGSAPSSELALRAAALFRGDAVRAPDKTAARIGLLSSPSRARLHGPLQGARWRRDGSHWTATRMEAGKFVCESGHGTQNRLEFYAAD